MRTGGAVFVLLFLILAWPRAGASELDLAPEERAIVREHPAATHLDGNRTPPAIRDHRQLAYAADRGRISLARPEKEMLSRLGEVAMCVDPDWMPYSRIDAQGRFTGMTADYMRLMAERIGVDLRLVPTETWNQTLDFAALGKCDVIAGITPSEGRKSFLYFTRPFMNYPLVAATRQNTVFIPDISSLAGKRVGAVTHYVWTETIRARHPEIELVEVSTMESGLRMVQDGELFAFLGSMASISYEIGRHRLSDLKIAGKLEESMPLAVGVRKQEPLLEQVFDKAVASITEEERRNIFNRWVSVTFEHGFDYALLWRVLAVAAVLLAMVLYWNRKLSRLNRAANRANADSSEARARMAALLDNAGQGFLSFGADGVVEPELSRECERLFQGKTAGMPIWDLFHPDDEQARESFARNIRRIFVETDDARRGRYLSLMPRLFMLHGRRVEAEYKEMDGDRLMLVLTDATRERGLEAEAEAERKRLGLIVAAVRDREDFFNVLDDFTRFIRARLSGEKAEGGDGSRDLSGLYRQVHTFKGLFLQLEFIHTPRALHEVETTLSEWRAKGEAADRDRLERAWEASGCEWALASDLQVVRAALGEDFFNEPDSICISPRLAERIEGMAARLAGRTMKPGLDPDDALLLDELGRLRFRDLRDMLGSYPKAARMLAGREGKLLEPFGIEGDKAMVDPRYFAPLAAALAHVFRNAVVHGVEEPDQRRALGKPEAGRIGCRVRNLENAVEITVTDDGRGVDMEAVAARAGEMGLKTTGDPEKDVPLVFMRDLTTREDADTLSGRGVGLFAVHEKLKRLGGTVRVSTMPGKGTTFVFTVPVDQPLQETGAP